MCLLRTRLVVSITLTTNTSRCISIRSLPGSAPVNDGFGGMALRLIRPNRYRRRVAKLSPDGSPTVDAFSYSFAAQPPAQSVIEHVRWRSGSSRRDRRLDSRARPRAYHESFGPANGKKTPNGEAPPDPCLNQ